MHYNNTHSFHITVNHDNNNNNYYYNGSFSCILFFAHLQVHTCAVPNQVSCFHSIITFHYHSHAGSALFERIFWGASRFGGARLERYHEIPMFVDSAHISVYSSPALLQALIRFWLLEVNLLSSTEIDHVHLLFEAIELPGMLHPAANKNRVKWQLFYNYKL